MSVPALPSADPIEDAAYRAEGWWGSETLHTVVRRHAARQPTATAFIGGGGGAEQDDAMSWRRYDELADEIAAALFSTGLERGECVLVFLPDTPVVHAAFVGAERAGLVVMGVGHRAGASELDYLLRKSHARAIITPALHRQEPTFDLVQRMQAAHPTLQHHLIVDGPSNGTAISVNGEQTPNLTAIDRAELFDRTNARHIGASELFLLNSTSGTTGLPKCVMQSQNRWFYFNQKAAEFGALRATDVFMSVVPAPFGFGLWTSHFTPTIIGAACVITERFSADAMIELIERHRVTVLSCVSTQFIMMLNSPVLDKHDVSSLRVMFTGGEAIPYGRALEFEQRTGGQVLNFYGSNETGILSGTRVTDDNQHRLTSGGRVVADMHVRLYTPEGERIAGDRGRGVPACKGPALSLGYYDDAEANAKLYVDGGWMLMGDVVEIDADGWLTVVGRTSDFIIRGGKNISAPAVEDEVATHPAVSMVAVVPAPDPVFGERVAAYVELHPGHTLTLEDLKAHLSARGVSREWYPEYLHVTDQLPRASGAKVAKGELKKDAATRFG
jgi:acyl-CoA synthetase